MEKKTTLQIEIMEAVDIAKREGYSDTYIFEAVQEVYQSLKPRTFRMRGFIDKEEIV